MKKIVALVACMLVATSGAALAAAISIQGTGTSIGGQPYQTSNNVTVSVFSVATGFTAVSHHSAGDRDFGTNNTGTKIYWKNNDTATIANPATAANAPDFAASGSTWTAL